MDIHNAPEDSQVKARYQRIVRIQCNKYLVFHK